MIDEALERFIDELLQDRPPRSGMGTMKAIAALEKEQPRWIEPHVLAVRFGLPIEQARRFLSMPGYSIKQKLYHGCCECTVGLMDKPTLPDEWECPECQRQVSVDEISFEPVAVQIREGDRNATNEMKNRCHSCKYWIPYEIAPGVQIAPGMGKCLSPKFVDGTSIYVMSDVRPIDGVFFVEQYDELYPEGHLEVGKDFGCIHWDGDRNDI